MALLFSDYFPAIPSDRTSLSHVPHDFYVTPCDCFIHKNYEILYDTGTACESNAVSRPVCKTEARVKLLSVPIESEDGVRSLSFLLTVQLKSHDFTH